MKNNAAMEDHWSNNPRFKAEQEPVAEYSDIVSDGGLDPRNTTPPQRTWVGLTEEELQKILQEVSGQGWKPMLEAIEAKLKEKNTSQDGDCKHCVNGCSACDARRQPNVLP